MIDRLRYAPASFWRCIAVCGVAFFFYQSNSNSLTEEEKITIANAMKGIHNKPKLINGKAIQPPPP